MTITGPASAIWRELVQTEAEGGRELRRIRISLDVPAGVIVATPIHPGDLMTMTGGFRVTALPGDNGWAHTITYPDPVALASWMELVLHPRDFMDVVKDGGSAVERSSDDRGWTVWGIPVEEGR